MALRQDLFKIEHETPDLDIDVLPSGADLALSNVKVKTMTRWQ